jgi:hypothetical protein
MNKIWHKFDDFMQDRYMSMPELLRDIVMGVTGIGLGVGVLAGIMLVMHHYK